MSISIPIRLLFVFMLMQFLFACNPSTEKKEEQKDQSKDEFALLNDQLAANPNDASLLYKRAKIFFGRKVDSQAFEDISKAVSIDSTKADYYMLLADICFRGNRIPNTIAAFNKAIALEPDNKEAHLKFSELRLILKNYPACLSEANEAIRIDKNSAKAYFIKGFAYKEMGDTSRAISSFQTATEINSDYYDAYIQLGNIEAARKHRIALQFYNNALRIQPSSTEAYYNRGMLFQNSGQVENALADYNTILKIDREHAQAHFNIGYIELAYKEDYKSAITHFTDAIRVNDQYVEAFYNRGLCYELLGDEKSAKTDYKNALAIFPGYKPAKAKLGR